MAKRIFFLVVIAVFLISFANQTTVSLPYTDFRHENASGVLKINVRNFEDKLSCLAVKVANGQYELCKNQELPEYEFFIKRQVDSGDWYVDLTRLYDYFPQIRINDDNKNKTWLKEESEKSHSYREDFRSVRNENGYEYRHSESRRNYVIFEMANDSLPIIEDSTKYQSNYEWDETIKGVYQSYYSNGEKCFRHKYRIGRFSIRSVSSFSLPEEYSVDVKVSGKIESYYPDGNKYKVVEYKDVVVYEKKAKDKEASIKKIKREAYVKLYYNNRKIKAEGTYENGIRHGKWTLYHSNGNVAEKLSYENGKKKGDFKKFSDKGTLLEKGTYE
jgi:antitoxin component YwqK of YwqJK toxin-antitoxin module